MKFELGFKVWRKWERKIEPYSEENEAKVSAILKVCIDSRVNETKRLGEELWNGRDRNLGCEGWDLICTQCEKWGRFGEKYGHGSVVYNWAIGIWYATIRYQSLTCVRIALSPTFFIYFIYLLLRHFNYFRHVELWIAICHALWFHTNFNYLCGKLNYINFNL